PKGFQQRWLYADSVLFYNFIEHLLQSLNCIFIVMNVNQAIEAARQAVGQGKLSAGAMENLEIWLRQPSYQAYRAAIIAHILDNQWQQLDDVIWTVIPFGT
ncbi:MAG TPA: hypothetical protein DCF63_14210, partial [Planctomycetaceae bacterium]|nr:hypothetical protein [Planctomycetaceae bacterium]